MRERTPGHYRAGVSNTGDHGAALAPDDIDDLARRARDDDREALEMLLAAVRPRVLNICRGVLPYSSDAEDACQEAMLNVATKIHRIKALLASQLNAPRSPR